MMSTKKFLISIIIIGFFVLIISKYLLQICVVRGISMQPTLYDKTLILIKKYKFQIHSGNIAVIKKNNKIIIKRVVGIPGDKLQIKGGYSGILENEIELNYNEYFVLGDNRNQSIDSRYEEIGIIYKNEFIGIKM